MLEAVPFLLLDAALVVLAFRRPWVAVVVLLGALPLNGIVTQVLPRLLDLGGPAELALAGWRDALVAGIVLAAAVALGRGPDRRLRPIEWLVLATLALGVVYLAISPVPLTAAYVYRVLYEPPLLLAAVLVLARTSGMPRWLVPRAVLAFLATVTVAALYSWPQVYLFRYGYLQTFYTEPGGRIHHSFLARGIDQPRAIGTLSSPNEFGAVLAIALVLLAVPGLLRCPGWVRTWLVAIAALALLLSFSRSGLLAAVVGVAIALWLSRRELPERVRFAAALRRGGTWARHGVPVLAALGLAVAIFTTSGAPKLVADTATGRDPSAAGRPASVRAGLAVLQDHPFGLGLGTAGPKAARFGEQTGSPRILTEMWYVLYAIQVGIGGLALLGALAFAIFRQLWAGRSSPLARAAIGFGLGLGAGALFIPIIEDPAVFTPLWGFSALAVALASARSGTAAEQAETGAAG